MVSQRARDRGKRKKAAVASRLTQWSNPELVAALVYCLRRCFKPGEWVPFEPVNAHFRTLGRKKRDVVRAARWMLKIHANKAKGFYMLKHPEAELEKFGLRWVDWSQLNPDLFVDKSILAFSCEHGDLWLMVKAFLLGQELDPTLGCYTPWQAPKPVDSIWRESTNPVAAAFQSDIRDRLRVDDFVGGVQAAVAADSKPELSKNVIREVNGQRFLKPLDSPAPETNHERRLAEWTRGHR